MATPVGGTALGAPQDEIHMDCIEGKHDPTRVGFLQDARIQERADTRRAASRIVMGSAPAMALSNSQRLPVSTLNKSAGVAKLMRGPDGSPVSQACTKSLSVSPSGRTSSVTVFIVPPHHVLKKSAISCSIVKKM
jgi:hypothetical protein